MRTKVIVSRGPAPFSRALGFELPRGLVEATSSPLFLRSSYRQTLQLGYKEVRSVLQA